MTTGRDLTRVVRAWMEEEGQESADRVLDAVFDQLDTTRQRRVGWPVRGLPEIHPFARLGLAAAAVVVTAVFGVRFLAPSETGIGGSPDATSTPTPVPISALGDGTPDAGRHQLDPGFPVRMSFDLPAESVDCGMGPLEQGVCLGPEGEVALGFLVVERVASDPCDLTTLAATEEAVPVDELVAALSALPHFETTPPEDVKVDGYDAVRLTVTASLVPPCGELRPWATPDRANGVGAGEANLLYVIDVDRVPVMISAAYLPGDGTESALARVERVVESVEIGP